jgi:acetyltransferase-like isoleucine patch superfamily enzyme
MSKLTHLLRSASVSLRHRVLSWRLAELGRGTEIQKPVYFEFPKAIRIGKHCSIARHSLIRANTSNGKGVEMSDDVSIKENVLISANEGFVVIGNRTWLGPYSHISGNGGVTIGNNVMVASHCVINTVTHCFDRLDIPMSEQGINTAPIIIEDDVWIGTGATILLGVRVGRGSIIGAGALVIHDIPPLSVAVGVPAKVTKRRKSSSESTATKIMEFAEGKQVCAL